MSTTTPASPADSHLDLVFAALSNRTRRAILTQLRDGPTRITDLASPFDMSLPAISKHIRVLEKAGLVRREVSGREHTCWFQPDALADAERWLTHYRAFWESTLDALVDYVEEKT